MPDLIDMHRFAAELTSRRNRAALLLCPHLGEERAYAAQLAAAVGAAHLDVLERFQQDENLMGRLVIFSIDDLLALIAEQKDQPLVVVSGIEFLLGAWLSQGEPNQVKRSLCQKIELWVEQPAFILVTQDDSTLAGYQSQRHSGGQVVIRLSETLALA